MTVTARPAIKLKVTGGTAIRHRILADKGKSNKDISCN